MSEDVRSTFVELLSQVKKCFIKIAIVEGFLNDIVKILKKKQLGRQSREKFVGSVGLREPHNIIFFIIIILIYFKPDISPGPSS